MKPKRYIDESAKVNMPFRFLQGCEVYDETAINDTVLPDEIYIGAFVLIGKGVELDNRVVIDSHCVVESEVKVGENSLITYKATIGGDTVIGKDCIIGGFIGENTSIGNNCRIFGDIIHKHTDPSKDWDASTSGEKGATIQDNVFIGFGAKITKPVTIEHNVYILPNTIVSRDIPPYHIAKGINEFVHYKDWKGELAVSDFFKNK